MIRQYYAQRARGGHNPLRVGVIPVGAILYLQNELWWRDRFGGCAVCRGPVDRRGIPERHHGGISPQP